MKLRSALGLVAYIAGALLLLVSLKAAQGHTGPYSKGPAYGTSLPQIRVTLPP